MMHVMMSGKKQIHKLLFLHLLGTLFHKDYFSHIMTLYLIHECMNSIFHSLRKKAKERVKGREKLRIQMNHL